MNDTSNVIALIEASMRYPGFEENLLAWDIIIYAKQYAIWYPNTETALVEESLPFIYEHIKPIRMPKNIDFQNDPINIYNTQQIIALWKFLMKEDINVRQAIKKRFPAFVDSVVEKRKKVLILEKNENEEIIDHLRIEHEVVKANFHSFVNYMDKIFSFSI